MRYSELVTTEGTELPVETIEPERKLPQSLEQKLLEMGQFADFHFFKQALSRDEVLSDLLQQNTQHAELENVLEALDLRVAQIFKNVSFTVEEHFALAKQIGMERASYNAHDHRREGQTAAYDRFPPLREKCDNYRLPAAPNQAAEGTVD